MDNTLFFTYLIIMAGTTYLIRVVPFSLIKGKIKNRFVQSFLYYIPFTVLACMTLPSALYATDSILSAAVGLLAGMIAAILGRGLLTVSIISCVFVFITELIMNFIK